MSNSRVENQSHKMAELSFRDEVAIGHFRNCFRVLDGRLVVHAMYDDQVEAWNHQKIMPARSACGKHARDRDFWKVDATVFHPPKILVASNFHSTGVHHLGRMSALFDPGFRHDLFVLPAT